MDHVVLRSAVFPCGHVSRFSGVAFSTAAGSILPRVQPTQPSPINRELLGSVAFALPALMTGTLFGMALSRRVDDRKFRLAVLVLLFVSGCLLVG